MALYGDISTKHWQKSIFFNLRKTANSEISLVHNLDFCNYILNIKNILIDYVFVTKWWTVICDTFHHAFKSVWFIEWKHFTDDVL